MAALYGARFRQKFTIEDAIGSHACSLEANMHVTNGIPLGSSLLLPFCTVNCGQTLKVKPDIVFFGESLPARFFELAAEDFPKCDLLIVMGTSLTVHPFASLVDKVGDPAPRLNLNLPLP
jgi:NAD-dependent SIR2 family protein deacetylase